MSQSTEDTIKEAAKRVFLEKGYHGATTRDIAKEAGINRALVNYYFRSKENLFAIVFTEMAELYFQKVFSVLQQPISFFDKLDFLLEEEIRVHFKEPQLTTFLIDQSRQPDSSLEKLLTPAFNLLVANYRRLLAEQIQKAVDEGEIISIPPDQLLLLMSSVKYLFSSKKIFTDVCNQSGSSFEELVRNHKTLLLSVLRSHLSK